MDRMADYHVRRLAVTNDSGVVVGWITLSDIARKLLLEPGMVRDGLQQLSA
jgi:CBS domain-containing protein